MALTEKRRILDKHVMSSYRDLTLDGTIVLGGNTDTSTIYSHQITRSESHRWPKAKGVMDVGGPFDSVLFTYENRQRNQIVEYSRLNNVYVEHNRHNVMPINYYYPPFGRTDASLEWFAGWIHDATGLSNLVTEGTKYVAQTIPTNPTVDGAVSLAELYREGIPSMIGASFLKDRIGFMRSLGGEYLNYTFGWAPLVSSLKDAAKAIIESEKILTQLSRDSGKNVYRKRYSQPEVTINVQNDRSNYPMGMGGADVLEPPWFRYTDTTTVTRWFSGCYTYKYEPKDMDNVQKIVQQASLLYGLELTPEVLWNLAPWSWLVDWFVNVGPLLHNVSAFQQDGLVLRYGYVMEETTRTINRTNVVRPRYGTWPFVSQDTFIGTRKRREKATPYGFGLTLDMLSNRQWAILAALGMSRKRGSLGNS